MTSPANSNKTDRGSTEGQVSAEGLVSISGVRLTQGNAVDCPQIKADDGSVHTVNYLSPAIALGDRVKVSGTYGITTSCLGTVLVVKEETRTAD